MSDRSTTSLQPQNHETTKDSSSNRNEHQNNKPGDGGADKSAASAEENEKPDKEGVVVVDEKEKEEKRSGLTDDKINKIALVAEAAATYYDDFKVTLTPELYELAMICRDCYCKGEGKDWDRIYTYGMEHGSSRFREALGQAKAHSNPLEMIMGHHASSFQQFRCYLETVSVLNES